MLQNFGSTIALPTSVAKFYVGMLGSPSEYNAFLKKILIARNVIRRWPFGDAGDYTQVAYEASKMNIRAKIHEYLAEVKNKRDTDQGLEATEAVFKLCAAKRAGSEGLDKREFYRSEVANKVELQFGCPDNNPFTAGFKAEDRPDGDTLKPFKPKTRLRAWDQRIEKAKPWITGTWNWGYHVATGKGYFTKRDPETPADLAGASKQRRGNAWLVMGIHGLGVETTFASEAPTVLALIAYLKDPLVWKTIPEVIRTQIDVYLKDYAPKAPPTMDWGHTLPRDMDGWNGRAKLYVMPTTLAAEIPDMWDPQKVVERPIELALALQEYLEHYVLQRANLDQLRILPVVHDCFEFRSITQVHEGDTFGMDIKPIFTTGMELSRAASIHEYCARAVLPVTTDGTPPIWADDEVPAATVFYDKLDIDGVKRWIYVERSTRDNSFKADGSCWCYRSISYYQGGRGSDLKAGDFERMALHFPRLTVSELVAECIRDWDRLVQTGGPWHGVTFKSKRNQGATKPKDEADALEGEWSGKLYLCDPFKHPDAVEVIDFDVTVDQGLTSVTPQPMFRFAKFREGLESGVCGPVYTPRTYFIVAPGLEAANFDASAMPTNWLAAIGDSTGKGMMPDKPSDPE